METREKESKNLKRQVEEWDDWQSDQNVYRNTLTPPYTLREGSPHDLELTRWKTLHQISHIIGFRSEVSLDFVLGRDKASHTSRVQAKGYKKNPHSFQVSSGLQPEEEEEKAVMTFISYCLPYWKLFKKQNHQREDEDGGNDCQNLQQS